MAKLSSCTFKTDAENDAENEGEARPHLCIENHVTRKYQEAAVQLRLHPQKQTQSAGGISTPEAPPKAPQNRGRC